MDIKKISELFTVAVPPLILCASIRSVTYYHTWNIPILDYLTPAELLFSFISPALVMLALAAAYLLSVMALTGFFLLLVKLGFIPKGKAKSDGKEQAAKDEGQERKGYQIFAWLIMVIFLGSAAWVFFTGIWYEFEIIPVVILHVALWMVAITTVDKLLKSQSTEAPEGRQKEGASIEAILLGNNHHVSQRKFLLWAVSGASNAGSPFATRNRAHGFFGISNQPERFLFG
jgi:hypothetical protein